MHYTNSLNATAVRCLLKGGADANAVFPDLPPEYETPLMCTQPFHHCVSYISAFHAAFSPLCVLCPVSCVSAILQAPTFSVMR